MRMCTDLGYHDNKNKSREKEGGEKLNKTHCGSYREDKEKSVQRKKRKKKQQQEQKDKVK